MPKRTALYELHCSLRARMIEFGGWVMPVQYQGIVAEHRAVRTRAGMFDLSHMGEIQIRGPRALEVCQELCVSDVARVQVGQAQYSILCDQNGGVVDDVIVYRLEPDRYFLCVNAANVGGDLSWMAQHNRGRATIVDRSDDFALIAVQGPRAGSIVQGLASIDVAGIRRYWASQGEVAGSAAIIARTGYTGEDGYELFVPPDKAVAVWTACMRTGAASGLVAAGLGARDTLRLEAGYLLYGSDMSTENTPLEIGLERLVSFDKSAFIGRAALVRQRGRGIRRRLVGLRMENAGIPRRGYPLWVGKTRVGRVTSGSASLSLHIGIALGYVVMPHAEIGTEIEVEIRRRRVPARIVQPPFYRKDQ